MTEPADGDAFRSHWLAAPTDLLLTDTEPGGPPLQIEIRAGEEEPAVIEAGGGEVRVRVGSASEPDAILSGHPQLVLGVLTGNLELADAESRGLTVQGERRALRRVRPLAPDTAAVHA
jgi:hypothetical protein